MITFPLNPSKRSISINCILLLVNFALDNIIRSETIGIEEILQSMLATMDNVLLLLDRQQRRGTVMESLLKDLEAKITLMMDEEISNTTPETNDSKSDLQQEVEGSHDEPIQEDQMHDQALQVYENKNTLACSNVEGSSLEMLEDVP